MEYVENKIDQSKQLKSRSNSQLADKNPNSSRIKLTEYAQKI